MTEEKLVMANKLQDRFEYLRIKLDDISHGNNFTLDYFSRGIHFYTPIDDKIVKIIVEQLEKELSEIKEQFEEL